MQTLQCTESRFVFIFFCPWKRKQINLRKDIFIGNIGHFLVAQKTHFQQNEKSYRLSNTPLLVLIWYEAIAMKQTNMETQTVPIPFFLEFNFISERCVCANRKSCNFSMLQFPSFCIGIRYYTWKFANVEKLGRHQCAI